MTAIYKKHGRRYKEIGNYEPEAYDTYPHGAHLVISRPGSRLTRFSINPDHAALLAAAEDMREAMIQAMRDASMPRISEKAKAAHKRGWAAYIAAVGREDMLTVTGASAQDCVQAGIDVLMAKAGGT